MMTGTELFNSYKMRCVEHDMPSRISYRTLQEFWHELAQTLDNENISKDEFLDFLFAKVAKPYPNVLFSRAGESFKYVEMYKQLSKSPVVQKIIDNEAQDIIREELLKQRVWLSVAFTELCYRKYGEKLFDLSKYGNSLYFLANEHSPIYLAYKHQKENYLPEYFGEGVNDKIYQALKSKEITKYFNIVEEIKKMNTTRLLSEYRLKYKKYISQLQKIEEPFKKITLLNMGTVSYI